jgi:selenocysteine-specific elongation factor
VGAKVALIENAISSLAPGQTSMAQLILDEPISAYSGERFVLRDDSDSFHLGGGMILDPNGPQYGKSKPERLTWLSALATGSVDMALQHLLANDVTTNWLDLTCAFHLREGTALPSLPDTTVKFDLKQSTWITTRNAIAAARQALLDALSDAKVKGSDTRGTPREKLIKLAGRASDSALLEATLTTLIKTGVLGVTDGRVHDANDRNKPDGNEQHWSSLERQLQTAGRHIPVLSELQRDARLDGTSLKLALKHGADRGFLHRINATRYALTTTLLDFAETTESLASEQNFTVANFKDELGIGRKLAVEILEFFDSINFTQRQGNERTITNPKAIRSRLKL